MAFDHRDPEIAALMDQRGRAQGRALGSPLADPLRSGTRRVIENVDEMRRIQQERDDPFELDDRPATHRSGGHITVNVTVDLTGIRPALDDQLFSPVLLEDGPAEGRWVGIKPSTDVLLTPVFEPVSYCGAGLDPLPIVANCRVAEYRRSSPASFCFVAVR